MNHPFGSEISGGAYVLFWGLGCRYVSYVEKRGSHIIGIDLILSIRIMLVWSQTAKGKGVLNVERRTWDKEEYARKAAERRTREVG